MARNTAPPKKKQPGDGHTDRTHIIALAIAAIVLVASCLYIHPYIPDDTYISLRYAENLVDGHGLTFNVGEQPVEAYSNLLWILTCAAFYTVGMSLPVVTPVAGVILALGSLFVLWVLYRRRIETPVQLLLPLLLFATAGPFVMYAVSGMEMALFSFLLILQIFFIDDLYRAPRRSAWIGLAISGAFLSITRPEGVVVLPFLLLYLGWDTRRDAQGPSIRRTAR